MDITTESPIDLDPAVIDHLNELLQVDYDALRAYEQAIRSLDTDLADPEAVVVLEELQSYHADHERHVAELARVIQQLGGEPANTGLDAAGVVLEGMAKLRSLTGATGALKAMRATELLANRTYERAADVPLPPSAREVVRRHREDERLHLTAIEMHLERLAAPSEAERDDLAPLDPARSDGSTGTR